MVNQSENLTAAGQATQASVADGVTVKKTQLSQTDIPTYTLEQSMRVVTAIVDDYAAKPARPLDVAKSLNMQPTTGGFRMLCGAAMAYGLTTGSYNAQSIALTELGISLGKAQAGAALLAARRAAILKPRVIREFLEKYDKGKLPKKEIAANVLVALGVPAERSDKCFEVIAANADYAGILETINGYRYVDLSSLHETQEDLSFEPVLEADPTRETEGFVQVASEPSNSKAAIDKIFISHGKNHALIEPIKEILKLGHFTPVVAAEEESVSKPVPDKVFDAMRQCQGAIIHVDAERKVISESGAQEVALNDNVLIEIGAAKALYRDNFILLVQSGVALPSNLQGLYQVRYPASGFDPDATIKLLKAVNELRTTT